MAIEYVLLKKYLVRSIIAIQTPACRPLSFLSSKASFFLPAQWTHSIKFHIENLRIQSSLSNLAKLNRQPNQKYLSQNHFREQQNNWSIRIELENWKKPLKQKNRSSLWSLTQGLSLRPYLLYSDQALMKAPSWILTGILVAENYIFTSVSIEGNLIRTEHLETPSTPHAKNIFRESSGSLGQGHQMYVQGELEAEGGKGFSCSGGHQFLPLSFTSSWLAFSLLPRDSIFPAAERSCTWPDTYARHMVGSQWTPVAIIIISRPCFCTGRSYFIHQESWEFGSEDYRTCGLFKWHKECLQGISSPNTWHIRGQWTNM